MFHCTSFLLLVSVATLVEARLLIEGEPGVHELARQMASKYSLVAITQLEGNNPTESISTHQGSSLHRHNTTFQLRIRSHDDDARNVSEWTIDLELNLDLVGSNFRFYSEGVGSAGYQHCYYHGAIRGLMESRASLSTCGHGVKGFIFDGRDLYHLEHYGSEGEHFLYRSDDSLGVGGTCGVEGSSYMPHGFEFGQKMLRSKRARANKFVEFYLVMDNAHYQLTGSNITYSRQYAIEIANHMDFIYRSIGIRIALVGAEVWSTTDFIATSGDLDILLDSWLRYLPRLKSDKARDGILFDNSHIITGLSNSESNVIGKAPLNTMCLSGSGGVNRDTSGNLATGIATTLCHEMGHNLGMNHDEGRSCNDCPDPNRGCVMNAVIRSPSPFLFTSCSTEDLHSALSSGVGTCIYNPPPRLFTDPICGNAFVEEGEECDCGSQAECPQIDPCCQPGACKLYAWAECGSGDCCHNCSYSKQDVVCREKTGDCDIEEQCSGSDSMCPDNLFRRNGLECRSGEESSYCYEGACKTLLDQCHYIWGTQAMVAADICFERVNILGNQYGYCSIDEQGDYTACPTSDVKCGKLHCDIPVGSTPIIGGGGYTITYYQYNTAFCTAISIIISDMPDPGLAPDGTLCDTTSVCYMGVCTNVSQLPYTPCPVGNNGLECSGLAECSNTGVCVGLSPSAGGSTAVTVISILAVLIVVTSVSVSGLLIGFWLYKKRREAGSQVFSKPAATSGPRTRGSSLSEIISAKLNSLPRYENLVSPKVSVNTSQPSAPPKPPHKPSGNSSGGPKDAPPSRPPPRMKPNRPTPPSAANKPQL